MEYRVRLETTIEDIEDVIARTLRNKFSEGKMLSFLLVGCTVACLSFITLLLIKEISFELRFIISCLLGILVGIAWIPIRQFRHVRRIHRIALAQYGKDPKTECVYEIKEDGLLIKATGYDITYHWDQMDDAKDDNGDVFITTKKGFHIVRKRAFSSDEAKNKYIAEINRWIDLNKGGQ